MYFYIVHLINLGGSTTQQSGQGSQSSVHIVMITDESNHVLVSYSEHLFSIYWISSVLLSSITWFVFFVRII